MNKKLSLVLALMVTGLFPALTIYAWQNRPVEYTEKGAIDLALYYLKSSPTYRYDGIAESINVTGVARARTPTPTWLVMIDFECAHSGYGDRTGKILLEVVTPHRISIVVEEGKVIQAIIDDAWDEITQSFVEDYEKYTEEKAVEKALGFLMKSPTFSFDGIPESVEVVGVETLRMPWTWEVSISFQCRQAGYGDRTGQVLAQVITPHEIRIVVSAGEVRSAVIDGVWDELDQREVGSELLPPEMARDLAVRYILDRYPELGDLELPAEWVFTDLTPEGLLGYSTFRYTGLGWGVNVSFMVVLEPVYNVYVEHSGDVEFTWEGTVDQSSTVTETSTSLTPAQMEILSPEQARDLAVEYVLANYPELEGVEEPTVWAMEDLTPEGLLGYSTFQYASGSWTVEVGFPVVWKPTYQVELTLDGEPVFTWTGTVAQDGTVSTVE